MNVTMSGQFFDTGFIGTMLFTDCWPCEYCGQIVGVSVSRDDDGSVCEITTFCDDCSAKCHECGKDCLYKTDCRYGAGYSAVRPDRTRQFRLSSGEHGWWDEIKPDVLK